LGLDTLLEERMERGGEEIPWLVMAFILSAAQLIAPSSELANEERFYPRTALEDICVGEDHSSEAREGLSARKEDTTLRSFSGRLRVGTITLSCTAPDMRTPCNCCSHRFPGSRKDRRPARLYPRGPRRTGPTIP
jgi:hypothetical protein